MLGRIFWSLNTVHCTASCGTLECHSPGKHDLHLQIKLSRARVQCHGQTTIWPGRSSWSRPALLLPLRHVLLSGRALTQAAVPLSGPQIGRNSIALGFHLPGCPCPWEAPESYITFWLQFSLIFRNWIPTSSA